MTRQYRLSDAPAPIDNPLKGLVPYAGDRRHLFPHSLEFDYIALAALVIGPRRYDWNPLEKLLNDIASRGHQAIFRVYLEYPGRKNCIPAFLIQQGLKVHRYLNTNTQPLPPEQIETPDYADPHLRKTLIDFIEALGKRYDGDPRIGFITAGLLGTWGEWHTYPKDELFASKTVQNEVLDAYEHAFQVTPILLRYPAGSKDGRYAANDRRRFGYHDDSFAWATLDTGKPDDSWFYLSLLKAAGPEASAKWKRFPIGGEIRPEAWGKVFDSPPGDKQIQDFHACVEQTHASWLMDSGMFEQKASASRRKRAEAEVRHLGYEFHIPEVTVNMPSETELQTTVKIVNRGVAPFYYDWPVEFAIFDGKRIVQTMRSHAKIQGILPGGAPTVWKDRFTLSALPSKRQKLLLRVVNPLTHGKPLRFANAEQDRDLAGWLTILPDFRMPI